MELKYVYTFGRVLVNAYIFSCKMLKIEATFYKKADIYCMCYVEFYNAPILHS